MTPGTAGLEEGFWAMAREVWEAGGLWQPEGMAKRLSHGFVMSEEVVAGESGRPGIGLYLKLLFGKTPWLPIRVVAHDAKHATLIHRLFGIPMDQVVSPREGESYEKAILRAAGDFRPERKAILVDIHRWAEIPTPVLPVERQMWLWRLTQLFRLLGGSCARGIGVQLLSGRPGGSPRLR